MSKKAITLALIILSFLLIVVVEGRGGRGGGGGGRGGGGSRGGGGGGGRAQASRSIQRSPSMSRATPRPQVARSQVQRSQPQRQVQRQQVQRSQPQRQVQRQQIQTQASQRLSQNQGARRVANADMASQFQNNRPRQQQINRDNAGRVRDRIEDRHPGHDHWFGNNFYNGVGFRPDYYNPSVNWWQAAKWSTVKNWMGTDWSEPYYYDSLSDVYYADYSSPDTSSDTYQAAPVLATDYSAPILTPQASSSSSWLPLGVFALSQTSGEATNANMFMQLALNKTGELSGTYYNSSTNKAYEMTGSVDPNTQQVTLQVSDKLNSPVITTAINNLTDYQTTVQMQFSNGQDQTWTLTRVEQ